MSGTGYPTPEEAALAEWAANPGARARVVSVVYESTRRATVTTDTEPSHPYDNFCVLIDQLWYCTGGSN